MFETRVVPLQGLLGDGRRAARAARGRRLERDLHLLPQHGAVLRRPRRAAGPGAPAYQGEVVDPLLPRERRWRYEVGRGRAAALRRARVADEVARLGGTPRATATTDAPRWSRHPRRAGALRRAQLVEVGIGCEACHGGSREHVPIRACSPLRAAQRRSCARAPRRRAASARAPSRSTASARAATRCCSPATRHLGRGGARGGNAGRQPHQLAARRATSCSAAARADVVRDCHDPHARRSRAPIWTRSTTPPATRVCMRCHAQYATRRGARARTRTTIRRAPAAAASPATCRRRTWRSTTR